MLVYMLLDARAIDFTIPSAEFERSSFAYAAQELVDVEILDLYSSTLHFRGRSPPFLERASCWPDETFATNTGTRPSFTQHGSGKVNRGQQQFHDLLKDYNTERQVKC